MTDESNKNQNMTRIQYIISMITFGTIGLFVKNIPLASAEISLWRGAIAFVIISIYFALSGKFKDIINIKAKLWKLLLSGIAMGFGWVLLFESYNYTSVALATLSYYFSSTIVIIASALLFKEKLSSKQIICFMASTTGLVLIIGVSGGGSSDIIGISYGLGAAFLYSTVILLNKATGKVDGISKTWVQFISAILVLIPYVYLTNGFHVTELETKGLINLLFLGVFHTGIIYCIYFTSLPKLKGQQAAILSYIDPLVAVFLSVFALGESITKWQLIGGLIILIFTFINEIKIEQRK